MNYIINFFKSTAGKRFLWSLLNTLSGMIVAFIAYLASNSVSWAMVALPIATGLSQMLTKWLMAPMVLPPNAE